MKSFLLLLTLIFGFSCNILPSKDKNNDIDLLLLAGILNTSDWVWVLPPGFPTPQVPAENPMTKAKVALGRHLFYEKKLSGDESMSCSSCHFQSLAFSDGKDLPKGITNETHPRNSQHLTNVAYNTKLTWANTQMTSLEVQSRVPLFGETPIELGLTNNDYLTKLKNDSAYQRLFVAAFGNADTAVNEQNVRFALSSFQRSMISGWSPFDKAKEGDRSGYSASASRGSNFFNGETAECFHCHGGFNFTDTNLHTGQSQSEFAYHNNGTHTKAYFDALPIAKQGLKEITLQESDQGKFKAPSLRNVGLTFPYMHDGSIMCDNSANPNHATGLANGATRETCARNALAKVITQYANGGNGHPNVDTGLIRPFTIQPSEKEDLINFLLSLTDQQFINDPQFSNPFTNR